MPQEKGAWKLQLHVSGTQTGDPEGYKISVPGKTFPHDLQSVEVLPHNPPENSPVFHPTTVQWQIQAF